MLCLHRPWWDWLPSRQWSLHSGRSGVVVVVAVVVVVDVVVAAVAVIVVVAAVVVVAMEAVAVAVVGGGGRRRCGICVCSGGRCGGDPCMRVTNKCLLATTSCLWLQPGSPQSCLVMVVVVVVSPVVGSG